MIFQADKDGHVINLNSNYFILSNAL